MNTAQSVAVILTGGGLSGLLDFLPPSLRVGGFAAGTSRLFGNYGGPLIRLRRGVDSVEQDAGSGEARVSSDAVTGFVGKNLLRYSNDFTNAAWAKVDIVVTPAFDGIASKIAEGATGGAVFLQSTTIPSSSVYVSVQATAKYSNNRWIRFRIASGTNALNTWVDLQNGAFGTLNTVGPSSFTITSVDSLGNGFYRLEFSGLITTNGTLIVEFFCVNADGSYPRTANGAYLLQDVQLEYGSTATTYEARTTTGASPCYVPKLYDQIGSNHALQATASYQPQIIPRQIGEMPILVGDGVDDLLVAMGLLTTFNDTNLTAIVAGKAFFTGTAGAPRLHMGGNNSYNDLSNLIFANSTNRRTLGMVVEGSSETIYENSVLKATANAPRVVDWGGNYNFYLGRSGSEFGNPPLSTILLPAALSPTNRAAVEAKLMTEYSIT